MLITDSVIEADLKLINFLQKENIITKDEEEVFTNEAKALNTTPIELLLASNLIEESIIVTALSEKLGFHTINLSTVSIYQEATRLVNRTFALTYLFFPIKITHSSLIAVMFNPFQVEAILEIEKKTGFSVKTVLASKSDILDSIDIFYQSDESFTDNTQPLSDYHPDKASESSFFHFLENAGVINSETSKHILQQANALGVSPIELALQNKDLEENNVVEVLAKRLIIPKIKLDASVISEPKALEFVSQYTAILNNCIPLQIIKDSSKVDKLVLVLFNPFSDIIKNLEKDHKIKVISKISTRTEILEAIKRSYNKKTGDKKDSTIMSNLFSALSFSENELEKNHQKQIDNNQELYEKLSDISQDESIETIFEISEEHESKNIEKEFLLGETPIVKLVNKIIYDAIKLKASDIHIEPTLYNVTIRNRVDGILQNIQELPKTVQNGLVSRIKILSKLDIAEKRVPQDGNLKVKFKHKDIDLRVSTLPTQYGEKVVLRILDTSSIRLNINELGFSEPNLKILKSTLAQPQGMILVTGPTGSGKTSTLYACLNEINSPETNLITIEDPVEYTVGGINQVQLNKKAGLNFATTLRSILRQDPDVIMVGEIRDAETAEISFNASLTGHFVMSTLHTNDSIAAITRLVDLGIQPFLISSSLLLVLAQRLVRKNCFQCLTEYIPEDLYLKEIGLNSKSFTFNRGGGCESCNYTGYKGRMGIYEILEINTQMKELINQKANDSDIYKLLQSKGMKFLLDDAIEKIKLGLTTVEEVIRVIQRTEVNKLLCFFCNSPIKESYSICPYCGIKLYEQCELCKTKIDPSWISCPNCNLPTYPHPH